MHVEAQRRRIQLPESGVEIALLDWGGSGPLALLHHANGFCAGVWEPVARALRRRFHVVGMDARGHGDSSSPEDPAAYRWEHFGSDVVGVVRALLAESGEDRLALGLGHSFGGTSFLMAAAAAPQRFERLVLLDPVIHPPAGTSDAGDAPRGGRALAEAAGKRRAVWPSRAIAGEKWRGKQLFEGWDPRVFELYLDEGLRDRADGRVELKCRPEVEALVFGSGQDFEIWPLVPRVTASTLLVRALRGSFPRAVYLELAARLAHAELREVDTGHLVPMESPELVVEEVLAFTAGASPG